jgi:hypothetical protein
MALTVIGSTGLATQAQPVGAPVSPWDRLFAVRVGGGFDDNVTLSSVPAEQSAFLATGFDAIFTRLPIDGTQLDFTLTFDDKRFFSAGPVDHETVLLTQVQLKHEWPGGLKPGVGFDYLYQDQVLDVSVTETNQAVPVLGNTFTGRAGLQIDFLHGLWAAAEIPISRQLFAPPLDDFSEFGAKVSMGYNYGFKSELTLSYEQINRLYDHDEQLTATGEPVPGTRKAFEQDDLRLTWRHHWDKDRRWRTTTRLGYKVNRDNGSGYFNFTRYQVVGQLRYRANQWEVSGEARWAYYDYPVQTVSGPGSPTRQRTEVLFNLRGERQIARALKIFAEYEHERVSSNLSIDEYTVNTVNAGIDWEF